MLPKILHLLVDHNNLGILYVSTDQSTINFLKEGFLEGSNRLLFPKMSLDGTVDKSSFMTEKDLKTSNLAWTNGPRLIQLTSEYVTPDFLENKRLAQLRAPFISKISQRVYAMLKDKTISMPLTHSFDSALQTAIDGSDVENNIFHRDIIELARIRGWSPIEVYKDLKMRLESSNSFKIKVYGLTMKFVAMANQCTTDDQLREVENEYDIITTKNQRI
jgi:hypothetical protein